MCVLKRPTVRVEILKVDTIKMTINVLCSKVRTHYRTVLTLGSRGVFCFFGGQLKLRHPKCWNWDSNKVLCCWSFDLSGPFSSFLFILEVGEIVPKLLLCLQIINPINFFLCNTILFPSSHCEPLSMSCKPAVQHSTYWSSTMLCSPDLIWMYRPL